MQSSRLPPRPPATIARVRSVVKRLPVLEQVQALLERASKRGEEFVPHELSIGPKVPFSAISSGSWSTVCQSYVVRKCGWCLIWG